MKQRSKYNSKKCECDGIKFDSKDEMLYYQYLRELQEIFGIDFTIELQPKFELIPNYIYQGKKRRGITYTADFKITYGNGMVCVVDVKGFSSQQGEMRRKLFEYRYNEITLQWVTRNIKHGIDGWIETDELKKIRAKNRKEKVNERD